MRARGHAVNRLPLPGGCHHGTFVAPTLIEVTRVADVGREVFGPVLHLLRYRRDGLAALLRQINATGYGLTFGVHSRLDETVRCVVAGISAGNAYVNRNIIGAVVGVQPFGGQGLSGTGPKAGGPLYLRRLLAAAPAGPDLPVPPMPPAAAALLEWLRAAGSAAAAGQAARQAAASRMGLDLELPGPVGEENRYTLCPRGAVLCRAATGDGLLLQLAACLSTGNQARICAPEAAFVALDGMPSAMAPHVMRVTAERDAGCDAVLFEGSQEDLRALLPLLAASDGPIRPVLAATPADIAAGYLYPPDMLMAERSISTNTAAAGGNATLMSL
jgi:RHH-type proline utilization regulon transcriptional repressor/proline dehydrogenase/delta 1-pyrroline-5-carboxylate dehydrogenase